MRPGDRIRTTIEWGCFKHKRGRFLEDRGGHVLVQLDGDVSPLLLFASEVVEDVPADFAVAD